ncbi:hypothetical protein MKZ17_10935 [Solibacillus sp. FSL R7-0682]|uniref:hypothetical protein n=1 Tax=Solibacillus sp. FSL R7-0682 TaxID=2921690 RepID=UPI0030F853AB
MSIYEALNNVSWKKKEYFLWKHDLFVFKDKPSEEELCKKINSKSLSHMVKWEKSAEYLSLVNVYIESQSGKDLEDIYAIVKEKALTGDEKSIKLLMDIQKQSREFNKSVILSQKNNEKEQEKDKYSELEL